jgi:hypothetical protein
VAGTYSLDFRYANGGTGDRPMSISVDGATVDASLSFPVTGWTHWRVHSLSTRLPAGSIKIRATEISNGPNVDNLTVTGGPIPTAAATPIGSGCTIGATCEAETAVLGGGVVVDTQPAGYTGRGFADYPGLRTADPSWDIAGLETRVRMRRDKAGRRTGWTATARIPWEAFRTLPSSHGISLPPRAGDAWRFNAFRIVRPNPQPEAPSEVPTLFTAWSPPPSGSFHAPAAFRDLVFSVCDGPDKE